MRRYEASISSIPAVVGRSSIVHGDAVLFNHGKSEDIEEKRAGDTARKGIPTILWFLTRALTILWYPAAASVRFNGNAHGRGLARRRSWCQLICPDPQQMSVTTNFSSKCGLLFRAKHPGPRAIFLQCTSTSGHISAERRRREFLVSENWWRGIVIHRSRMK